MINNELLYTMNMYFDKEQSKEVVLTIPLRP